MTNYLHLYYSNLLLSEFCQLIWWAINRLLAFCWGVNLGNKASFTGKTLWSVKPSSKIVIGDNCTFNSSHRSNKIGVYSPCMFSTLQRNAIIKVGNNCGFSGTVIGAAESVTLGDNVRCGANTMITDSDWHTDDPRTSPNAPVMIEDNVWLGYGVKVLKGVTIGKNSLIGACSVVTHNIPPNVVAAGNPCKVIKQIEV